MNLESVLIERQKSGTLVNIAREMRLALDKQRVHLNWIDEASIALVEAAISRGRNLTLVYPAPAGQVAVLLAGQILIHRFISGNPSTAVGIVTGDPAGAERTWKDLNIISKGSRSYLNENFPCWRAKPDGQSPFDRQDFQGILIGRKCRNWHVDVIIIEQLVDEVQVEAEGPNIRVVADPLNPILENIVNTGDLIWGWCREQLKQLPVSRGDDSFGVPFSVAEERLVTIVDGGAITVGVCGHPEAERAIENLREDLLAFGAEHLDRDRRTVVSGLRRAWMHTSTLCSLPCRPVEYDRFCGVPPVAARETSSFHKEIEAWAQILEDDHRDFGLMIATDLFDLRAALERDNPFKRELLNMVGDGMETLVVVRTKTAARAITESLGGHTADMRFKNLQFTWMSRLHNERSWPRAVIVGAPPRSAWHRVDSGLSADLRILTMGKKEAARVRLAAQSMRVKRVKWANEDNKLRVWRELFDEEPPDYSRMVIDEVVDVLEVAGEDFLEEPDPFSPIAELMTDDRPLWAGEGAGDRLARPSDSGEWSATTEAVEVRTLDGSILLPVSREVDVMAGDRITSVLAPELKPGHIILIGRQQGRLGLIEALQETLERQRPDLLAANLLTLDYHDRVISAFNQSGLDPESLYHKLLMLDCNKGLPAVRSWVVSSGGPMGPRDEDDHFRLNSALGMELSGSEVREYFAAINRIRTFRRQAGRALSRAATAATATGDDSGLEEQFGISVSDLNDAVVQTTVVSVQFSKDQVPLSATGRLTQE